MDTLHMLRIGAESSDLPTRAALTWLIDHWPEILVRESVRLLFETDEDGHAAYIDWEGLALLLDRADSGTGPLTTLSGGAATALRIGVSLATGRPCAWRDLYRLDDRAQPLLRLLAATAAH